MRSKGSILNSADPINHLMMETIREIHSNSMTLNAWELCPRPVLATFPERRFSLREPALSATRSGIKPGEFASSEAQGVSKTGLQLAWREIGRAPSPLTGTESPVRFGPLSSVKTFSSYTAHWPLTSQKKNNLSPRKILSNLTNVQAKSFAGFQDFLQRRGVAQLEEGQASRIGVRSDHASNHTGTSRPTSRGGTCG